jgi:hypothetical protein
MFLLLNSYLCYIKNKFWIFKRLQNGKDSSKTLLKKFLALVVYATVYYSAYCHALRRFVDAVKYEKRRQDAF